MFNSLLRFCSGKHIPSQGLRDFSVANLETIPRSIYLELLIIALMNIHLNHGDFYHLFLLDLFVITRLIAADTWYP